MLTCIEPQRWPGLPGPDAADSEIEAFIEHTEICSFHAGLLRDEEALLRCEVTCARSVHPEGRLLLTPEDRALVERQRQQFLDWSNDSTRIKRLLVRVPGKIVAHINLSRSTELNFGVENAPFFQIWKAGRWKRPEVLLTTYPLQGFAHSSRRSHLPLANGGFLTFRVEEVAPSQYECHLSWTQPATEGAHTSAQGSLRDWKWQQALLGLVFVVFLLTLAGGTGLYFQRGKNAYTEQEIGPQVAKREDPQPSLLSLGSSGPHHEGSPDDTATVRSGGTKNLDPHDKRDQKPPARDTKFRQSTMPRRSSGITRPAVAYSQVRSVYLDPSSVNFPQQLHDELSKQIGENGFAIEPSRDRADARLRILPRAHGGWAFRLVNDSGLGIPVSTIRADVDKPKEVKRAARQVVEALLQVTSSSSTPQ